MITSNPDLIRLALSYKKVLDTRVARYQEECEAYAREGYRPHYCYHGTNMWVDWDCACWMCENDDGPPYWETAKWALIYAHNEMNRVADEEE